MSRKLRVAVTGGSGNIGHALCKALVARGDEVLNLDRRAPREPAGRFIYCDLRKREFVQPIFEQADAVCLLGELSNQRMAGPEEVFSTNTMISSTALQTAADLKIPQIIYTSSVQAYGYWDTPNVPPKTLPFDETAVLEPQNVYALSKAANESYARMISKADSSLSISIFRLPWVVMEHMQPFWMREHTQEPPRLDGFGTYLHRSDAVQAYLHALDRPRQGCEAYHFSAANICHKQPLAELIARFQPHYPPLPADWPARKSPMLLGKAKELLDWEPTWDMQTFIEQSQPAQAS